ncbi:hypothetical protein [Actinokineospora enzanensis]|uniref:hypothetical protein n=1 Tax=Actinokineospora enzanensis TaxID=155975 RepID=UPI0012EC541B|nr:hypothetical protein [Actinokineospora enzanensis]
MGFNLEYTSKRHDISYALTVTANDDGDLGLDLAGHDHTGTLVAEGALSLPPGGAAETARLLREALDAISHFEGRRARRFTGNANQRWTAEQDGALREAWLARPASAPAGEVIRALAGERLRSPAAIRARLPRVGCDPDVAGRLLTAATAELVGGDAVIAS